MSDEGRKDPFWAQKMLDSFCNGAPANAATRDHQPPADAIPPNCYYGDECFCGMAFDYNNYGTHFWCCKQLFKLAALDEDNP